MAITDPPSPLPIDLGGRPAGPGHPCFVVAEIGTAHGGDIVHARELADAAAEAGADAAKLQYVIAREIIHPDTGTVPLPGGPIPLFDRFRELERDVSFYAEMKEYIESKGMVFLCTPFGTESAERLESLPVAAFKIASPELNHFPLLEQIGGYGKPVILSSGVSTLADIEAALSIVGHLPTLLLHCITSYPAPEEEYNLRILPALRSLTGRLVGVSDHSADPLLVPLLSLLMGSCLLEKHITLSRSGGGLDDPIALPPDGFARMIREMRRIEAMPGEDAAAALRETFGAKRMERILGTGRKTLAPSELPNYGRTNRSLHALRRIPGGAVLEPDMIGVLRTEKVLRPGLHPRHLPAVLGKRTSRAVGSGQGITWDDVLFPG